MTDSNRSSQEVIYLTPTLKLFKRGSSISSYMGDKESDLETNDKKRKQLRKTADRLSVTKDEIEDQQMELPKKTKKKEFKFNHHSTDSVIDSMQSMDLQKTDKKKKHAKKKASNEQLQQIELEKPPIAPGSPEHKHGQRKKKKKDAWDSNQDLVVQDLPRSQPDLTDVQQKSGKKPKSRAHKYSREQQHKIDLGENVHDGSTELWTTPKNMDLGVPIPYKPKVPITTTTVTGFGSFRQRLHPTIIDTLILDMKFESMTPVQEQTMTPLLDGLDCHIQAKTGTGKTIAFLVPSIDKILKTKQQGISLLVIAPTRELALQIADSAKQVCARFNDIKVGIAIGGTNVKTERDIILRGLNILIATPGRLLDHLTDANVATQLYYLQTFVLDEADRLLDMGFSPDILKIIQYLPKTRQSLLCSATVTPRVSELAARVLRQEYVFLTTIVKGESNTHEKIRQTLVTAPFTQQLLMTISILMLPEHKDSKVIVFLPTAHLANLYHAVCSVQFPSSLVQHARQSQKKRTTVSEQFRDCKQGILFATDVVARGMDFPNVQLVIQVGVCDSRETYIHRIGRTGRSEQEGKAYLILAPEESYFLKRLKGIKIESNHVPVCLDSFSIQKKGVQAYKHEANDEMTAVYQSWLGFYKAELKNIGWSPAQLVQEANVFAGQVLDCDDVPPIKAQTVGKMGLKGVPGLNIVRRS